MFSKERHLKKRKLFLLEMDTSEMLWGIPEDTLWLDFDEASAAAIEVVTAVAMEGHLPESVEVEGFELDRGEGTAFLPGAFEIMPISISTKDRITWFGEEWHPHEENIEI